MSELLLEELKPCICGKKVELEVCNDTAHSDWSWLIRVHCWCGITLEQPLVKAIREGYTADELIEEQNSIAELVTLKWNTRPTEATLQKENQIMKTALEFADNKLYTLEKAGKEISPRYMTDVKKAFRVTQNALKQLQG